MTLSVQVTFIKYIPPCVLITSTWESWTWAHFTLVVRIEWDTISTFLTALLGTNQHQWRIVVEILVSTSWGRSSCYRHECSDLERESDWSKILRMVGGNCGDRVQIQCILTTKPLLSPLIKIDYFVTFLYHNLLPLHLDINSRKSELAVPSSCRFSHVEQISTLEIHGQKLLKKRKLTFIKYWRNVCQELGPDTEINYIHI